MISDVSSFWQPLESAEQFPAPAKILAVDLGTSYFKVGMFNQRCELELLETVPAPLSSSSDERAEIDVAAFRDCISGAVHSLRRQAGDFSAVRTVSFASQANSFALFDRASEPITPFILWSDGRARSERMLLDELANIPAFYETTGVAQLSHLLLPAKIAWLQRNEPQTVKATARIGLISDYFTWWLTGNWYTEASVAGLTSLANIHTFEWWQDACSSARIGTNQLSRIVRAGTPVGTIRQELTREWGLHEKCELIVGCLDQFAGAIGVGNVLPGEVSETTGTVLATIRCAHDFDTNPNPGVFQGPGFRQGIYYQLAFSELSAGILERYRKSKAPDMTFAQLDHLATSVPPGAAGLKLRTDAFHRPVEEFFAGRTAQHAQPHEVRAILEAIAEESCRQVRLLTGGIQPVRVVTGGGAARSKLWLKIKSDALGCPFVTLDCEETACRGAALLAVSGISGVPIECLIDTSCR